MEKCNQLTSLPFKGLMRIGFELIPVFWQSLSPQILDHKPSSGTKTHHGNVLLLLNFSYNT